MKLLSVDWDYFFPTGENEHPGLWDWGYQENLFGIDGLWMSRATGFLRNNLPLPRVNDEWQTFWQRVNITKHATLYFAESHAYASNRLIAKGIKEVVNYDAHHDLGYDTTKVGVMLQTGVVDCENWLAAYRATGKRARVIYPRWKTWAFEAEGDPVFDCDSRTFDTGEYDPGPYSRVFVCRSGAWVPPWCDGEWSEFIERCPCKRKIQIRDILLPRSFTMEKAQHEADQISAMMKRVQEDREKE